ncbi:MAG: adenosylcobinamide-GDP ribazoletransferase, partial [Paracoccaceae bacterium]
ALAALALAGLSGLAAIVAAGLAALWVGRLAQRRLGGATGDVYGAAAAVAETAALVAFAGALG